MKIEQIYTGCLAHGAYYIESNGEAAIVDPLRESKPYIERAEKDGAKIKYILETHFHADFVSGHLDLAKKTGAEIVFGPTAKPDYDILLAEDGQELILGNVKIKVLHTPGHTMESSTFLLIDENGKDHAMFSGDTLFLGDVGRPDLAVKTDLTREDLAAHLYDSLYNKILPLADDVIVYPGHGAGSACGKNMSSDTVDTLGNQKKTNYALQPMSKEEFVAKVTDGLMPPPQYFGKNAMMNKSGYDSIDNVLERGSRALSVEDFETAANAEEALIIDTRSPQEFAQGFIPNSIFFGIDGGFAPWVGALITDLKQPILLVAEAGREEEIITRLARVGYDNTIGYLQGGFQAWKDAGKEVDSVLSVPADSLVEDIKNSKVNLVDVRKSSEHGSEHVLGSQNFPLDYINDKMGELDKNQNYHIHCAGGYRSMITCSILKSRGFENITDIQGGFKALKEAGAPKSDYVCPSTML